jgi:hypothetical protein
VRSGPITPVKIQLLSDLHLETEVYAPRPAPGADLLVLAGDVDSTWAGLSHFRDWPVPVLFVPGNHEFDRRDVDEALAGLRTRCTELGLRLLERESLVLRAPDGRRVRFLGTTRWCDFDLFGEKERPRAMRAATYFVRVMQSTRGGAPFDPAAVRAEGLRCRDWLAAELDRQPIEAEHWDVTVVITHFGPSLRSADPRYGRQPGTASFCNADDALLAGAQLWLHGHLHCRHDYLVPHAGGLTRVVSNARGHAYKGEADGHDGLCCVSV